MAHTGVARDGRSSYGWAICALSIGLLFCSRPLAAQVSERADIVPNRFVPSVGSEGMLGTETAQIPGHLQWDAALWLDFTDDPMTLKEGRGGSARRVGALVHQRLDVHLLGAVGLFDWVQVGFEIPVTAFQNRDRPTAQSLGLGSLQIAGLGDVGLYPKVRLLRAERHFVDLAAVARVWLPTAVPRGGYLGEQTVRAAPEIVVSKPLGAAAVAFNGGVQVRGQKSDETIGVQLGHEMYARLGGRYDFSSLGAPLEMQLALQGFSQLTSPFASDNGTGLELLAGASYPVMRQVRAFVGGGAGLESAYSVPDYRVFAGVRFSRRRTDADGDGLFDDSDACPNAPEDSDGFQDDDGCPDLDRDQDGVADANDRCPERAGRADLDGCPMPDGDADGVPDAQDLCPDEAGEAERSGCPVADADGDGVADAQDMCPQEAGTTELQGCPVSDSDDDGFADHEEDCPSEPEDRDSFEDGDGCPDLDNDGDGVMDARDGCPNEPGSSLNVGCPDADTDGDGLVDRLDNCPEQAGPKRNSGCQAKQLVKLTSDKVEILEKVHFASGKARIRNRSLPLLNNVAEVIQSHPNIPKVRIEGHTDSRGPETVNARLSQARADAVRAYLIEQGIEPLRLDAVGYGERRPVASNRTGRGRAKNRRVEFVIVRPTSGQENGAAIEE